MPYNLFSIKCKLIKGARPVDGCTDKNYRGKGIFKKLMNYCLNEYHYEYDFLFANPNKFSYPEFMKWDGTRKPATNIWSVLFFHY